MKLSDFTILQPDQYLLRVIRTTNRYQSTHLDLIVPDHARQDTGFAKVVQLAPNNPLNLTVGDTITYALEEGGYKLGELSTKYLVHPGTPIEFDEGKHWLIDAKNLNLKIIKD